MSETVIRNDLRDLQAKYLAKYQFIYLSTILPHKKARKLTSES